MRSVDDLAHFVSLQFQTDPQASSPVVSDRTLREMHAPVFLDDTWQHGMALGWELVRVQNETALHKGGSVGSFAADLLVLPGLKAGMALVMNTTANKSALNRAALELVVPVLRRALQRQATNTPPNSIPAEWTRYEGQYAGAVGDFTIRWTPTKHVAVILNFDVPLEPRGQHQFRMTSGPFAGENMEFVVPDDGDVRQARSSGHTFERVDK